MSSGRSRGALHSVLALSLAASAQLAIPSHQTIVYASATPEGVTVSAAYVDTQDGHAGPLPSPWNGDQHVTFQGSTQGEYDTPALKFDNPTNAPIGISFTADYGQASYGYTDQQVDSGSIPANGSLIEVFKLASAAAGTSGPDWSDLNAGCTKNPEVPHVFLHINDQVYQYSDDGLVMSAGGADPDSCNHATESHQWAPLTGPLLNAPSSVAVSTDQPGSATISWSPAASNLVPVTGYKVTAFRNGSSSGGTIVQAGGNNAIAVLPTTTTAVLRGLAGNLASYYFGVQPLDAIVEDPGGSGDGYGFGPFAFSGLVQISGRDPTYASTVLQFTANRCTALLNAAVSVSANPETSVLSLQPLTVASAPIIYYRMSEKEGLIAADSSGCGNDALYSTTTLLRQQGAMDGIGGTDPSYSAATAAGNPILTYTEPSDIFHETRVLPSGDAPRTMEAWFKTSYPNYQDLAAYGDQSVYSAFGVGITDSTVKLYTWANDLDCSASAIGSGAFHLADGNWHHIIAAYSGHGAVAIYVDGFTFCTGRLPNNLTLSTNGSTPLTVGSFGTGSGTAFQGAIQDFALYSYALTGDVALTHWGAYRPWSQDENQAWPENLTSDPNCGACVKWVANTGRTGTWVFEADPTSNAAAHTAAAFGFAEWNALSSKYSLPTFTECVPTPVNDCIPESGVGFVLVMPTTPSDPRTCGTETDYLNGTGTVEATIQWNQANTNCSLPHVFPHEIGHVLGEGHSSSPGDLMYQSAGAPSYGSSTVTIDSDSECFALTVYGPATPGTTSCYGT